MARIASYLLNMLPYMLCALPAVLLIRFVHCRLRVGRGRTTVWHELGVCLFALSLVGLLSQTCLPKLEFSGGGIGVVGGSAAGRLNLIPGMVFVDTWRESVVGGYLPYLLINLVGNLCLFLPFGFFLPLLWRGMSLRRCALCALALSLLIELCQFPQARGTDIDDLWLNTLGAVLGFLLCALLRRCAPRFCDKFRLRP